MESQCNGNEPPSEDVDTGHLQLLELAQMRMPFGKYKNRLLIDLPEPYIVWFAQNGFPAGKLGNLLRLLYEIKINGLEYLFEPLRK